jgi:dipeptidyl aminopeptidase/acylaminoacyl peptidase
VASQVNYRSGVGYGARFRLCAHCMSSGAAEYADVRTAGLVLGGRWTASPPLPATALADPKRVGIWGISYGGLNALQVT